MASGVRVGALCGGHRGSHIVFKRTTQRWRLYVSTSLRCVKIMMSGSRRLPLPSRVNRLQRSRRIPPSVPCHRLSLHPISRVSDQFSAIRGQIYCCTGIMASPPADSLYGQLFGGEERKALVRVKDITFDQDCFLRVSAELGHGASETHPIQHFLLATVFHRLQGRISPHIVVPCA